MPRTGPYFTQQAREAAREGRRRRAEQARAVKAAGSLDVFVTRAEDHRKFTWQIRQYGLLLIEQADESFDRPSAALRAGMVALEVLTNGESATYH